MSQPAPETPPTSSNESPEITLGLLEAVERDSNLTQRSAASELGIALGLAHTYFKRCISKGLIKVKKVPPRRYAYYLTPQGFLEKSALTAEYLTTSLRVLSRGRHLLDAAFAQARATGCTKVAVVGQGDLAELARLISRDHNITVTAVLDLGDDIDTDPTPQVRPWLDQAGPVDAVLVADYRRAAIIETLVEDALGAGRAILALGRPR